MMNFIMTTFTNWNNAKPMFWIIRPMVIFFCLFAASTPIMTCRNQSAIPDSMINFSSGFYPFWIICTIILVCSLNGLVALIGLFVFVVRLFSFIGFGIILLTNFAGGLESITGTVIKFRNRFNLLASPTLFCLNRFRHGCFSNKQLCLGPLGSYILPYGSSYYGNSLAGVN